MVYETELIELSNSGARYLVVGAIALSLYGVDIYLISIKDFIELKKSSQRDKDKSDLIVLNELLRKNKK
jgi:hypothetical protein